MMCCWCYQAASFVNFFAACSTQKTFHRCNTGRYRCDLFRCCAHTQRVFDPDLMVVSTLHETTSAGVTFFLRCIPCDWIWATSKTSGHLSSPSFKLTTTWIFLSTMQVDWTLSYAWLLYTAAQLEAGPGCWMFCCFVRLAQCFAFFRFSFCKQNDSASVIGEMTIVSMLEVAE